MDLKSGLILEGGTFRPVFTCGFLDFLLEKNVMFPYCIGVSAGITFGISYITKQKGRNMEIFEKYRNDKRYVGIGNFRKCKSLFGLEFAYDEIPNKLIPLDWEALENYEGICRVGVTEAATAKAKFLDAKKMDNACTMLQATCALPLFFPEIVVDGTAYYDGGLAQPISLEQAKKDGCEKFLIILTQPKGYVKKIRVADKIAAAKLRKKYPKLADSILSRPERYNKIVEECDLLERQGKALVIRPDYKLKSFESNLDTMRSSYLHGYEKGEAYWEQIKEMFEIEGEES